MQRFVLWSVPAVLSLLVAACAPTGNEIAFAVILEGDSASDYPRPEGIVIASQADWEALQKQLELDIVLQPKLPAIDFAQTILVAVFAGEKPSGGYSIRVERIVQTDREVIVNVMEAKPASDQFTIAQITYPYQVVSLPRTSLAVRFDFEAQVGPRP